MDLVNDTENPLCAKSQTLDVFASISRLNCTKKHVVERLFQGDC
jgi:hypothetical protein